jgi:iron complex outermembrane recepter protein
MKAKGWIVGASFAALAWATPALAQTPPADPGATTEQAESPAPAQGDVIVTARRRNENLQTTPLSGSVITGADLANKGVANVDALQFATPSVVVNNFGQGIDFNVRGIGKGEHNTQTATGVITYRDGAPTFPGYFQLEPYYDVANIQVLRGPQGTIVGQNATGGAVFVNSNDPIIGGGYNGYINANVGNYAEFGAQGAVNLPVSDTFAARIALYGTRRQAFYDTTGPGGAEYTGNEGDVRQLAGRLSLLWRPTPGLSILSKTDLVYLDQGAYPATPFANFYRTIPGTTTPNPNFSDLFDNQANSPQEARDKFYRTILRINYEFAGGLQLRSVTAFASGNTKYRADLDGTAALTPATADRTFFDSVNEKQYSQELTLISPDNRRFSYLLGVFGVWNKYNFLAPFQFVTDNSSAPGPASEYRLQGINPNRSLAAFGQIGIAFTPQLKLEAGGRYTHSRSRNDVDVLQFGTPIVAEQLTESDDVSYKVSLGWEVSRDHYLYGFIATGFKPGGLNVPVGFGQPDPFRAETVTSYEAGWKANFADRRIRTTIAGFYNSYRDFQVIIGNPTLPVFGLEVNVPGTTKIYGFEAEADARFGRFNFGVGVNVLHSELGRFFAVDPRAISVAACNPNTGPASASCLNLEGREQTYAPNFTFNANVSYDIPLGGRATLTPRVNYGHIAPQWATLFENPTRGDRIVERNIVNAQLALNTGSVTITAYATNLTDQHYPAALNSGLYFAGPPRQYGIKVLKAF